MFRTLREPVQPVYSRERTTHAKAKSSTLSRDASTHRLLSVLLVVSDGNMAGAAANGCTCRLPVDRPCVEGFPRFARRRRVEMQLTRMRSRRLQTRIRSRQ